MRRARRSPRYRASAFITGAVEWRTINCVARVTCSTLPLRDPHLFAPLDRISGKGCHRA
jgi:hypothetical protein